MKKILALLLACMMIFGLFAVIPASAAASESESIFAAYEAEKHPGWWAEPTVEGYDGYISVNAEYAVHTKEAYDMNNYNICINNLTAAEYPQETTVIISPEPRNTTTQSSDYANGLLSTRFLIHGNGGMVRIQGAWVSSTQANGNNYYDFAYTTDIRISFKKELSFDEETGFPSNEYTISVGPLTYSTTDKDSWLAKLMNSESFSNSYVNFGSTSWSKFNAALIEKDPTEFDKTVSVDVNGYQNISGINGKATTRTGGTIDFTKKAMTINADLGWWGESLHIALSADSSLGGAIAQSNENTVSFLLGPNQAGSRDGMYFVNKQPNVVQPTVAQNTELASLNLVRTTQFNIAFCEITSGKWAMVINNHYYTHDVINTFMNSDAAKNAYVYIQGYNQNDASIKFDDKENIVADWISNNRNSTTEVTTAEDGSVWYETDWQASVITSQKHNFLDNVLSIDYELKSSYGDPVMYMIGFSADADYYYNARETHAADGHLYYDLFFQDGFMRIHHAGGNEITRIDPPADNNVTFTFVEENGEYALYINDVKIVSEDVTAFCENGYVESTYASTTAWRQVVNWCPEIKDVVADYKADVFDGAEVKNNVINNVSAYTDADSLYFGKGYVGTVYDAQGNVRKGAMASGDTVVVTYRDLKDVATYTAVVLGDTNGDAVINAEDIKNIRKELLGVEVDGIFEGALNAKYDDAFDILDFIAAKNLA